MKSKMIKIAFVAAIVLVVGINVFNAQQSVVLSDIGMENVEALSNGEDSNEDCLGSAEYSFVGLAKGTLQEYSHKANGKDQMNTYEVERCIADGSGTLRGTTGILSKFLQSSAEVPCTMKCLNNTLW